MPIPHRRSPKMVPLPFPFDTEGKYLRRHGVPIHGPLMHTSCWGIIPVYRGPAVIMKAWHGLTEEQANAGPTAIARRLLSAWREHRARRGAAAARETRPVARVPINEAAPRSSSSPLNRGA